MKHEQSCPAFTSGRKCDCNYREAPTISPNDGEREALPELPVTAFSRDRDVFEPLYTAKMMRAYARATLAAASPDGAGVPAFRAALSDLRWAVKGNPSCQKDMVERCRCMACSMLRSYDLLAAPQAQPEPSNLAKVRLILERMDRKGGLGLDVHEWIRDALDALDAFAAPQPEPSVQPPAEASDALVREAFNLGQDYWAQSQSGQHSEAAKTSLKFDAVLRKATPQPPAPVVPLTREQEIALVEAHCIPAEDAYFKARPQIDWHDRRRVFQAGFKAGIEAAHKIGDKP